MRRPAAVCRAEAALEIFLGKFVRFTDAHSLLGLQDKQICEKLDEPGVAEEEAAAFVQLAPEAALILEDLLDTVVGRTLRVVEGVHEVHALLCLEGGRAIAAIIIAIRTPADHASMARRAGRFDWITALLAPPVGGTPMRLPPAGRDDSRQSVAGQHQRLLPLFHLRVARLILFSLYVDSARGQAG